MLDLGEWWLYLGGSAVERQIRSVVEDTKLYSSYELRGLAETLDSSLVHLLRFEDHSSNGVTWFWPSTIALSPWRAIMMASFCGDPDDEALEQDAAGV
jgi:hypothetical protein